MAGAKNDLILALLQLMRNGLVRAPRRRRFSGAASASHADGSGRLHVARPQSDQADGSGALPGPRGR